MRISSLRIALWLALAGLGCSKSVASRSEPSSRPASSVVPSVAVAPPPDPVVTSAVDAHGLHVESGTIQRASVWGFSDITVDLKWTELEVERAPRGALLNKLLTEKMLAVINGGYFEADFKPSGWLKSQGEEFSPKADTSKGGVFAVRKTGVYVGPFSGLTFEPELAIQSHPLIVEAEGASGIHRDDGRRAARTVVCVSEGRLRFILIAAPRGDGPTLFESAALLRAPAPQGFGCSRALNLDGGPSSGVVFGPGVPAKSRLPVAPVAYAIAIHPR
ncbi:MAG TPA: phosphodiester glycosidase family protein [Polyangiaceae bacterium]|nr:phosphodiester glycosidase family protein [Polyangiaceae bacterium]